MFLEAVLFGIVGVILLVLGFILVLSGGLIVLLFPKPPIENVNSSSSLHTTQ